MDDLQKIIEKQESWVKAKRSQGVAEAYQFAQGKLEGLKLARDILRTTTAHLANDSQQPK